MRWQARRDSNPQHPDLESDDLPLELLACMKKSCAGTCFPITYTYLVSLCAVCLRQNRQYLENSSLSGVVRLFLVVV